MKAVIKPAKALAHCPGHVWEVPGQDLRRLCEDTVHIEDDIHVGHSEFRPLEDVQGID